MLKRLARAPLVGLIVAALLSHGPACASDLRVVVSNKAVHALVSAVMGKDQAPTLLISGTASPHSYSLRPSEVQAANHAQVLFRISDALEPFTVKLVKTLPPTVTVVSLQDAPGMTLLPRRAAGAFEAHHGNDAHNHDPGDVDPHVWLDPENAIVMIDRIAAVLSQADASRAGAFAANAAQAKADIRDLSRSIAGGLAPLRQARFFVLHDAFQYFEHRFGLTAAGSIAPTPEAAPSGKRLAAIRRRIVDGQIGCVVAEPGMQASVIAALVEGTAAKTVTLDPEATHLAAGQGLYAELMTSIAAGFERCLAGASTTAE